MPEPSACGPHYLGVDETSNSILNVNDMAVVAFRMATAQAINVLLEQGKELPLTSKGTSNERAAKLLATHYVSYNDQGRGGETHVFGEWTFLSQSTIDQAIEAGYDAFVDLLVAGADKAASQPESQDSLDFLNGLIPGPVITSLAGETLPEGTRSARYARALAKSQNATWSDEIPPAKNEAEFLALLAGGLLDNEIKSFFKQKNVSPSPALKSLIWTLNNSDVGGFWRVYQAAIGPYDEAGGKTITRVGELIRANQAPLRPDFIDLVVASNYPMPPTRGGLFAASEAGASEDFAQARALWRQSQGKQPNHDDANRLGVLFFEDAKTTGRPELVAWAPHNRGQEAWQNSLRWMASEPRLDDPRLVRLAHEIVPGLLTADTLPEEPAEFLKVVFDGVPVVGDPGMDILDMAKGEHLVRQVVEKAVALHDGAHHVDAIFSRVVKNACAAGGSRLALLEAALADEAMAEILGKHKPNIQVLKELRDNLNQHGMECPRVVFLLDQEWRQLNGHAFSQDNFQRAWSAWTKDDKPHMAAGHQMALSLWRKDALIGVSEETQEKDERAKPRHRM